MLHAISQTLASAALLSILLGLPALYFLFSERFQRLPTARELSTLFIILALAGLILALPALAVLGASVLLAVGIAWAAAELSLDSVEYVRTLSPRRLFAGEAAELAVTLENRKFLPLAWLRVADRCRRGIRFAALAGTNLPQLTGLVAIGGTAFTVGSHGTRFRLWRSPDAYTWTELSMPVPVPAGGLGTARLAALDGRLLLAAGGAGSLLWWAAAGG